ncbi:hypothetical protein [Paludibacterium yongneupense]|uniref:hypothetical protein n=1 Tax=Paludibacterium yongneupense TaxID=400061 RepID=UPI0012EC3524|nr:hypothetical protein [Paludibacterium yongneupense]
MLYTSLFLCNSEPGSGHRLSSAATLTGTFNFLNITCTTTAEASLYWAKALKTYALSEYSVKY